MVGRHTGGFQQGGNRGSTTPQRKTATSTVSHHFSCTNWVRNGCQSHKKNRSASGGHSTRKNLMTRQNKINILCGLANCARLLHVVRSHMRSGTPSAIGNLRPVSGQIRAPSTTCMSMSTRCNAWRKEESSRSSGVNAGGKDPSGMPTCAKKRMSGQTRSDNKKMGVIAACRPMPLPSFVMLRVCFHQSMIEVGVQFHWE